MMQHHSVMKSTIKQQRRSRSVLLMGFITLILMTISLPYAQADTIDYMLTAVSPTNANGFDAELSGTFSYDTMSMTIPTLDILLTTSSFPYSFDESEVTNAEPEGFILFASNSSPPPTTIEVSIEAIMWDLGDTMLSSPDNTVLFAVSADGIDFFGESIVKDTGTAGPGGPAVPEPGTALLLATGLLGLAGYRWKQRHRDQSKGNV